MTSISAYAKDQYELVKSSRQALLDYCKTISDKDFIDQNTSFGRGGSIRNLLVHIINTYEYWIANIALKKNTSYSQYEKSENVKDVISGFEQVDKFMNELIENMENLEVINYQSGDAKSTVN
ncbi:MAG: damage-inducible protein DinB, partial [Bacteroidia bacterium]|nr:damage-inducible protein DinB [Bacteroidia bacterium]